MRIRKKAKEVFFDYQNGYVLEIHEEIEITLELDNEKPPRD